MTDYQSDQKIALIINPHAGRRRRRRQMKSFSLWLQKTFPTIKIFETIAKDHASILTRELISTGYTKIIAAGGDGTVNEVAREMINTDITLGIIPIGSGNGLARHLGIPTELKQAWDLILKNNTIRIDSAEINGIPFFSIAGTGFDALVADTFAHMNGRGFINYLRATIGQYFKYRPKKYKIAVNDHVLASKALFISFANSNQFGYNTSIAPEADLCDGLIDVCIMQKVPAGKAPLIAPKLFTKKLDRSRYLHIVKARDAIVYRKSRGFIHIDGDPIMLEERTLKIRIIPSSINIIVP